MNRCDYVASCGKWAVSFDGSVWENIDGTMVCNSLFPDLSNALYYMYYKGGNKVSSLDCVDSAEHIRAIGWEKAHEEWILEGIEP